NSAFPQAGPWYLYWPLEGHFVAPAPTGYPYWPNPQGLPQTAFGGPVIPPAHGPAYAPPSPTPAPGSAVPPATTPPPAAPPPPLPPRPPPPPPPRPCSRRVTIRSAWRGRRRATTPPCSSGSRRATGTTVERQRVPEFSSLGGKERQRSPRRALVRRGFVCSH